MDPLTRSLLSMLSEPGHTEALHELFGDFLHMVRNRLHGIKLGLYLARRGGQVDEADLGPVQAQYQAIEQFVARFQEVYRPMVLCPMSLSLGTLLGERRSTWAGWMERRGRTLEWLPPAEEPELRIDPGHLTAALDAWVSWRAEEGPADTVACVSWQATATDVRWTWSEADIEVRIRDEARPPSLAPALLARIAIQHGGRLILESEGTEPGFGVSLVFPRTEPGQVEPGPRRPAGARLGSVSFTRGSV